MSTTTNQASASKTVKRRNWTLEEDIVLLKQVIAEAPFAAGPRRLTDAWTALAETIKTCDGFTREVDGKKCQNRFLSRCEAHKTFNRTSARLSGVNEDEDETIQLLDNVLELVDEAKAVDQFKSAQAKEDQMKIEEGGHYIRDMALQSLGKRQKKTKRVTARAKTSGQVLQQPLTLTLNARLIGVKKSYRSRKPSLKPASSNNNLTEKSELQTGLLNETIN
ncbi:hypothetical protein AC1031_014900 [Aphanomyces cochlioides]|nr:hypothetical protein AC1031_014900 [Aphanomyces cochlioides]